MSVAHGHALHCDTHSPVATRSGLNAACIIYGQTHNHPHQNTDMLTLRAKLRPVWSGERVLHFALELVVPAGLCTMRLTVSMR